MIKKLLPLLLLILIGCSSPEPINMDEMLIERDDIFYTRDTNKPYSGPVFTLYENGQLSGGFSHIYKDGLEIYRMYDENLQLTFEDVNFKDGSNSMKFYNENGQLESEDTYKDGELIDSKEY